MMRMESSIGHLVRVVALVAFVWSLFSAAAVSAQTLQSVPFPVAMNTAITDCSTPTVVTLGSGQAITFQGGQFVHYTDANFDGTMYMTSSAAGCQPMPPDLYYDRHPMSQVVITFSKPVPAATIRKYDLLGPPATTFDGWVAQTVC